MSLNKIDKANFRFLIIAAGIFVIILMLTFNSKDLTYEILLQITTSVLQINGVLLGFIGILVVTMMPKINVINKKTLTLLIYAAGFNVGAIFMGLISLMSPVSNSFFAVLGMTMSFQLLLTFLTSVLILLGLFNIVPEESMDKKLDNKDNPLIEKEHKTVLKNNRKKNRLLLTIAVGVFIGVIAGSLAAPLGQTATSYFFDKPELRVRIVSEQGWIDRTTQIIEYQPSRYTSEGWSETFRVQIRNVGSRSSEAVEVIMGTNASINPGALRDFHTLEIHRNQLLWERAKSNAYSIGIIEPGELYEARFVVSFNVTAIEQILQDEGFLKLIFNVTDTDSNYAFSEEWMITVP